MSNNKLLIALKVYEIIIFISIIFSFLLSAFAMFNTIRESGKAVASTMCNLSVYVAFWPSMLFSSVKNDSLFTYNNWIINGIVWAVVICEIFYLFKRLTKKDTQRVTTEGGTFK